MTSKNIKSSIATSLALIVCLRVARRWNQTGQKLAGEPDIAKTFLHSHNMLLWAAAGATYVGISHRLGEGGLRHAQIIVMMVICPAFNFKIAYTHAEAPELLQGFPQFILNGIITSSLLIQARVTFVWIFLALAVGLITRRRSSGAEAQDSKFGEPRSKGKNTPLV